MAISLLAYPPLQRAWGTLPLTRIGLLLAVLTSFAIPSARFAVSSASQGSSTMQGSSSSTLQYSGHLIGGSSTSSGIGGRRLLGMKAGGVGSFNSSSLGDRLTSDSGSNGGIGFGAWAVLYAAMMVKSAAGCAAFTGSMIMVNALPPADQLGQVNGVGQSLASLARGGGPAAGGMLWGAAVHAQLPGAQLLPYAIVALSAVAGWVLYQFVTMPEGTEVKREQQGSSCCQE